MNVRGSLLRQVSRLTLLSIGLSGGGLGQSLAQETTTLEVVIVGTDTPEGAASLSEVGSSDTGRTTMNAQSVSTRTDTTGDATSILKSLPTVQYLNNSAEADDEGENADDVVDFRPLEVSISGAQTDENMFMLNGVSINSTAGAYDPVSSDYGNGISRWDSTQSANNIRGFYGMSSQSQYTPSTFVEEVELFDSNVSAKYGNFQGGVVNYKLKKPDPDATEWHGATTFSYQDNRFANYHIATDDGENPKGRTEPEWQKFDFSVTADGPVTDSIAALVAFSRRYGGADKQMDVQYVVDEDSEYVPFSSISDFYRVSVSKELDEGELNWSTNLTHAVQEWVSNAMYDVGIDVGNVAVQNVLDFDRDLDILGGVHLNSKGLFNYQSVTNESGVDEYKVWTIYRERTRSGTTYVTDSDLFSTWCQNPDGSTSTTYCYEGGAGSKSLDDVTLGGTSELDGDLLWGTFLLGGGFEYTRASRTFSGLDTYTATKTTADAEYETYGGFPGSFVCDTGDDTCTRDVYFSSRLVYDDYDTTVNASKFDLYAQTEQEWRWLKIRAGLRGDYNTYLQNYNVAPRFVSTVTPFDNLSFTFGANRYYSGDYITYAIHDNTGGRTSYSRSYDATSGEVGDWVAGTLTAPYRYGDGDLRTPYNDELTGAVSYDDPFSGGNWRLKYLNRQGRDQFSRSSESTTRNNILSNEGSSSYQSVTLEYTRDWRIQTEYLEKLGVHLAGVWAQRDISNNTYFDESIDDEYIYYGGSTYTKAGFQQVTGNLDIPLRFNLGVTSTWLEGRLRLGLSGDVVFGYTGVRDSGDDADELGIVATYDGADVSTLTDVYEDYDFDTNLSLNATVGYTVAEIEGNPFDIELKVSNLLDDVSNMVSSDDNPWVRGRTIALTGKFTW